MSEGGSAFQVGDRVEPRPEWRGPGPRIPTGTVTKVVPWGLGQVLYVEGERRPFLGGCFQEVTS